MGTTDHQTVLLDGIAVLVRGWLHGNSVLLLHEQPVLVDTGYHSGAETLEAWLREQCPTPLQQVLLTHVHSDHAGAIAALRAKHSLHVRASHGAKALVDVWDEPGLWIGEFGQQMPRFSIDEAFGEEYIEAAGRTWKVVPTPGHMRCAVAFYCEKDGVLLSGDALWENGFGMLDPWYEGLDCFDRTEEALERLAALPSLEVVVPGHGKPFTDAYAAIARAQKRLAYLRNNPDAVRRAVAQNAVGFLAMARPELGLDGLFSLVQQIVRAHPVLTRTEATPDDAQLINDAFAAMAARAAKP